MAEEVKEEARAARLFARIQRAMEKYRQEGPCWDEIFLEIFAFQADVNPVYRNWLKHLGIRPGAVEDPENIPPVPVEVFKSAWVSRHPPDRCRYVFRSTGTTRGPERRSRHPWARMELYDTAATRHFRVQVLPDRETVPMLLLGPRLEYVPESSLAYMLEVLQSHFATPDSLHAWGAAGPDYAAGTDWLDRHADRGPVVIFGTALALHGWLEYLRENGRRGWSLAPASRLLETGGFKGRRITLDRDTFYRRLREMTGIPEAMIGAEYGMTELGSQLYDNTFALTLRGATGPRRLIPPPWLRVYIWDPIAWRPVKEPGATGPIAFFDAANLDSIAFLVTEDLGRLDDRGLQLLGRVPGSEPRGCSLLAEF